MKEQYNKIVFERLSIYLNNYSDYITQSMVKAFIKDVNTSEEKAVIYILASILHFDSYITNNYLINSVKHLDKSVYENNPYYKNIKLNNIKNAKWEVKYTCYNPYEIFVYNDIKDKDGMMIPSLGFFNEKYYYPVIYENKREWMMITPNEIETMKKPIENSFGNVLTYGLGLGYFAYMASIKENVKTITIVEKEKDVIKLFNKYILPFFNNKEKIKIVNEDAFTYAKKSIYYDYVFVDIWHDPTDGVELYKKFKRIEKDNIKYDYWIEETLKFYL